MSYEKITTQIEMTEQTYSTHVNIRGKVAVVTGKTFEKLKQQITKIIAFDSKEMYKNGEDIPEVPDSEYKQVYLFDFATFLRHYNRIFTHLALND